MMKKDLLVTISFSNIDRTFQRKNYQKQQLIHILFFVQQYKLFEKKTSKGLSFHNFLHHSYIF